MRVGMLVVVQSWLAVVASSGSARADDSQWKDGCPPYYQPAPSAADFGTAAQSDTSLGSSRFVVEADRAKLNQLTVTGAQIPPVADVVHGFLHVNTETGPTVSLDYSVAFGPLHNGNGSIFVGYRHVSKWFDDAVRAGASARFGVGNSLSGIGHQANELNQLAITTPFSARYFAFDRVLTGTLEGRMELIGCYAPFIHLRVDATEWKFDPMGSPGSAHNLQSTGVVIPLSLSVGGYVFPRVGVATELAVELRAPQRLLELRDLVRVRNVLDFRMPSYSKDHRLAAHLLLHGDLITGDGTGFEIGVGVSIDGAWSGAFE